MAYPTYSVIYSSSKTNNYSIFKTKFDNMMINSIKTYCHFIILLCFSTIAVSQQQTVGVFIYDKEATSDGYVFFSPGSYTDAFLIDNCGFLINSWERNNRPGLSGYLTDTGLMLRTNKVNSPQYSQASTGGNIELVDWNNNTVWSSDFNTYDYIQHHDAVLMPNGNIIFIGWERISPSKQMEYGRRPSSISYPNLWGEFVREIKPIGNSNYEVVWEWRLQDHFVQDYDPSLPNYGNIKNEIGKVDINYLGPGAWDDDDWWHCNALDYNPDLDQILVNSRNNNELWIIDHSTTIQEAQGDSGGNSGKGGELLFRWGNPQAYNSGSSSNLRMYGSHGHYWIPEGLPNAGKIMYFNNGDDRPQGYYSTVEMIDPVFENGAYQKNNNDHYFPIEPEVVYKASPDPFDFVSSYLSNAQQLSNGNVFINEGGTGRLFEIDSNDNIIWEYITPVNFGGTIDQGGFVFGNSNFRAYRYSPDHPAFEDKNLSPGNLIEGDSEFNQCASVSVNEEQLATNIDLFYDINSSILTIQNSREEHLTFQVHSISGQQVLNKKITTSQSEVNLTSLQSGIYFIQIRTHSNQLIESKKIIKL